METSRLHQVMSERMQYRDSVTILQTAYLLSLTFVIVPM